MISTVTVAAVAMDKKPKEQALTAKRSARFRHLDAAMCFILKVRVIDE